MTAPSWQWRLLVGWLEQARDRQRNDSAAARRRRAGTDSDYQTACKVLANRRAEAAEVFARPLTLEEWERAKKEIAS